MLRTISLFIQTIKPNTNIKVCNNKNYFTTVEKMSKQKGKSKGKSAGIAAENKQLSPKESAITLDKSKNILINILAKPGAKQNAITDITEEGVGIQINAPPTDGEANTELVKYISSVVGVRKGDVSLEKGFKSRQKTVKVLADSITLDEVQAKIYGEMKQ